MAWRRSMEVSEIVASLQLSGQFSGFSERELQELVFARVYVREFNHGTPGSLSYQVIEKLAVLIEEQFNTIHALITNPARLSDPVG
jgi:hypothetical protein